MSEYDELYVIGALIFLMFVTCGCVIPTLLTSLAQYGHVVL